MKNGEKLSKMVKKWREKMVKKVKNGQKRLTTVKTGQYGQNWFLEKSKQSTTVKEMVIYGQKRS